ncbi:uncharacterized protein K02A2.6-like [Cydia splendana]|uniref:uncharacterized protein K02A2.6-like n=1 Tax=Cydia splendana TaxID=1100963 RepID=UPI00300CE940
MLTQARSSPYGLGAALTQRGADGVERPLCCASRTLNAAECNYSQLDKEALAIVFGVTKHHQKESLNIDQGCLIWGYRVVIPKSLRVAVLNELHGGHPGIVKMKQIARNYVWWDTLDADIERVAEQCAACRAQRSAPAPAPLHSWPWPGEPWARLNLDFLGPFNNAYYLVIIDAHSKWIEVEKIKTGSASVVINCLRTLFARFGLPKQVVTDNGPPFSSAEFGSYLRRNGIRHTLVAPYHPASNGAAENAVRTIKRVLKKAVIENEKDVTALSRFLFMYRNTEHSTTKKEPAVALLGRRLRGRLDLLRPDTADVVRTAQRASERRSEGHALRQGEPGAEVLVRDYARGAHKWAEGQSRFTLSDIDDKAPTPVSHQPADKVQVDIPEVTGLPADDTDQNDGEGGGEDEYGTPPGTPTKHDERCRRKAAVRCLERLKQI